MRRGNGMRLGKPRIEGEKARLEGKADEQQPLHGEGESLIAKVQRSAHAIKESESGKQESRSDVHHHKVVKCVPPSCRIFPIIENGKEGRKAHQLPAYHKEQAIPHHEDAVHAQHHQPQEEKVRSGSGKGMIFEVVIAVDQPQRKAQGKDQTK